ncbi:hypothetical protein B0H16DRAFT_1479938 [Mycena metata]|uniref:Uncharacterized protein n=1 Tax=Mycena metata TaxID=1033252 RepID=A0AAD7H5A5_9AGAR|nr:hypothetical protein B0H16DRAFT_1479938 [Mycena metata]
MQHPDTTTTAPQFRVIWTSLDQMNNSHAAASLHVRLDREGIMMTTYFAWRWLDAYCPEVIRQALADQKMHQGPMSWIAKLAMDVANILELRTAQHVFSPSVYGLELNAPAFNYTNRCGQLYVDYSELVPGVISLASRILASWLQFPLTGVLRV